jgi:hypothetical protein
MNIDPPRKAIGATADPENVPADRVAGPIAARRPAEPRAESPPWA